MTVIVFIGVFALQLAGYALWRHIGKSIARMQFRDDQVMIYTRDNAPIFIGGVNRPGEN